VRVAGRAAGLLEYLEDPAPGLAGMAEVAARAPMPLATNMCVVEFGDLPEAVRLGSVGVVLADHHYWGGLTGCARLAAICRTWGLGLSMHSNSHLGISLAAMTHLAAAAPNLTYAVDTHTPWQCGVDVLRNPLRFAAEKGRHMLAHPRSIPAKALDYAKYDMVRALNQVLDITGLRAGMLERLFARAIAVPAGRFLRMKRSVNLRVRESGGKGIIADGRYQSPILVQWRRADHLVRRVDVTLTRFE
jgi:hypothetical protein